MSTDVYADGYAFSHLHQPAGTNRDPIVITSTRRFKALDTAMAGAAYSQPPERSTNWDRTLTSKTALLDDWKFGIVTGPGHEVVVCAHPVGADSAVITAAWHTALSQAPLRPQQAPTDLAYEPAPKYPTDAQWAAYTAIHTRAGTTPPTTREQLDQAAERRWRKAHGLAQA